MSRISPASDGPRFAHEALFYEDQQQFLDGTLPFVREGLAGDEPVLVALDGEKSALLERGLGADAALVRFVDMPRVGLNPARIIPVWRDFVAAASGAPARGIGEPAWPGRSDAELSECERHESLLNLAFADAAGFSLLCPYDAEGLSADALASARRSHPAVVKRGRRRKSAAYVAPAVAAGPFAGELPAPPGAGERMSFDLDRLRFIRHFVGGHAHDAGLAVARQADLALVVTELTTNSIRHGGGTGTVAIWREPGALVCEVEDGGEISEPLAGRTRPSPTALIDRGLWIVNQLCDLVQIRSRPGRTLVRVRMNLS